MSYDNAGNGCGSMLGLSDAEQLVIWAIRKIVVQQGVDPNLPVEFQAAFGDRRDEGLQVFCSFVRLLGQAARRPYEIAPPCTLLVTPDEKRILTLLGAAQRGAAAGDFSLLEAHLLWLAAIDHRAAFSRITRSFAALLAAHGHHISVAQAFALPEKFAPAMRVRPRMREALQL